MPHTVIMGNLKTDRNLSREDKRTIKTNLTMFKEYMQNQKRSGRQRYLNCVKQFSTLHGTRQILYLEEFVFLPEIRRGLATCMRSALLKWNEMIDGLVYQLDDESSDDESSDDESSFDYDYDSDDSSDDEILIRSF